MVGFEFDLYIMSCEYAMPDTHDNVGVAVKLSAYRSTAMPRYCELFVSNGHVTPTSPIQGVAYRQGSCPSHSSCMRPE
jgi:hypothetical protein